MFTLYVNRDIFCSVYVLKLRGPEQVRCFIYVLCFELFLMSLGLLDSSSTENNNLK